MPALLCRRWTVKRFIPTQHTGKSPIQPLKPSMTHPEIESLCGEAEAQQDTEGEPT
jgi:hypothetical protein